MAEAQTARRKADMSSILIAPTPGSPQERENVISRLSSWVGQNRRPAQGPAQTSREPALADETLDQIGAENEEIKNRCIDFVRKIDELSALKENFVEISNWIGQILSVREQTNAALVERAMMIALAEGALADLKAESRALYDAKEEVTAENALLRAENERLKASVRSREARIEAVEAELHSANEIAAELRQNLETERAHAFHVKSELEASQSLAEKNDALISQLQVDLAAARDQSVFAKQHAEMLQANLLEAQDNAAKLQAQNSETQIYASGLADNIRELEIALESERRQLAKLDELLASHQAEHLKAQTRWRDEKDEDRRMIAELEAKVDKLTTHAQAGDRLLVEVRAELQAKIDECRVADRRAQEIEQKFARLTEHAESVSQDAAQLKQDLETRERAYARLNSRAKGLIRAMRDMSALLEKSEQKAQLTSERLAAETKRFDDQKSRLEQTVRDLTEQLEKERLSKMVTAGALEAARQQRLQPREEVKLADILARAEEAHNAAEASAAAANLTDPPTRR
jgi:regulator of replication initiation timing